MRNLSRSEPISDELWIQRGQYPIFLRAHHGDKPHPKQSHEEGDCCSPQKFTITMLKRFFYRLFVAITSAIIVGCANMPSGEPTAELTDTNNGVAEAVITFSKGTRTMDAWFYVRRKGEADKNKYIRLSAKAPMSSASFVAFSPLLSSMAQPDFPDMPNRSGRAMAVSLPPGDYEMYSWTLYIQTFGGYGYISPSKPPQPLSFIIRPGRITYLGNLHADTVMGKNFVGIDIPGDGAIDVSDKFERDDAFIKAKFPKISNWPVDKAQLNGKLWAPQ